MKNQGVQVIFSAIRHPQSNIVERYNKEIGRFLRTLVGQNHQTWSVWCSLIAEVINSTVNETTALHHGSYTPEGNQNDFGRICTKGSFISKSYRGEAINLYEGPYRIYKKVSLCTYDVIQPHTRKIRGRFHITSLKPYFADDNGQTNVPAAEPEKAAKDSRSKGEGPCDYSPEQEDEEADMGHPRENVNRDPASQGQDAIESSVTAPQLVPLAMQMLKLYRQIDAILAEKRIRRPRKENRKESIPEDVIDFDASSIDSE
ncbi:unnamed protein product [Trichogramma brassicae]|uniref:Integrase catalytic domain-containing protein n=1 Tax=Trichogramma brassicae TaxID=86971 RepID=A0A6H5IJZ2_9HYME|nr:unnamed protein product [Trichogramma brassicae]